MSYPDKLAPQECQHALATNKKMDFAMLRHVCMHGSMPPRIFIGLIFKPHLFLIMCKQNTNDHSDYDHLAR